MNTPIIRHWFFYFAWIADTLRISLILFGCIVAFFATITLCASLDDKEIDFVKKSIKSIIRWKYALCPRYSKMVYGGENEF